MSRSASSGPSGRRSTVRLAHVVALALLFLVTAVLGAASGVLFAYGDDMPQIQALDTYQPPTITRLYARDGQIIREYATERRDVIGYDDMAPHLREAILASEDAAFERHFGLSVPRILATAARGVVTGQRGGASTITQQVARILFLQTEYMAGGVYARTGRRGWERKVKEALLAIQLEKRFTKREIFTFYANHVPLGRGAEGVEAAARMYFDKTARDLTLEEAAAIAATIQLPARVNPFDNPEGTLTRRNAYVLRRMVAEGFVTPDEAAEASDRPLVTRERTATAEVGPYFNEEIRKALAQKYGTEALYQQGLQVYTTLDVGLQTAASAAIDRQLRVLDKRLHGYRRPARNVLADGRTLEEIDRDATFDDVVNRWNRPIAAGDIVPAVVVAAAPAAAGGAAHIRIGSHDVGLPRQAFAWTRRTAAADLFRVGDVIEVEVGALDDEVPTRLQLEQTPAVEGALVAIENNTGQILAMVGGYSFARSEFNRAVQAKRQAGSLFKALLYSAAIDRGYTPVSIFVDEPVEYDMGPDQPPYTPGNYDGLFVGPVTLRRAIEQSRNVPAVRAMVEIGPEQVVSYSRRFGLPGDHPPYLSVALGAIETTLLDMTSAYTVFPNRGVRMEPYAVTSITDREGNVQEETRPRSQPAIRADTAFVMTHMLRGVVQRGTAASAGAALPGWPLAGKTGTVNDYTDAWFIGFDPDITVGVWVGHDVKQGMGQETGSRAALPIWIDFMRAYLDLRGDRDHPPSFDPPSNIVFVEVEPGVQDAFIAGTQPQDPFPLPLPLPLPADAPESTPDGPGSQATPGGLPVAFPAPRTQPSN